MTEGLKIVVCGGRRFTDVPKLWHVLDECAKSKPIRLLIEGASDDITGPYFGADYWAHQWALARNVPYARCHAEWKKCGRAAGQIRNSDMIRNYKPDYVIAFAGGRGTADMIAKARKAGIPFKEVA